MGFTAVSLVVGKAILLLFIGILVILNLAYPNAVHQHYRKSRDNLQVNDNDGYLETPYLSRKLLGEIWNRNETGFPPSPEVQGATVSKRIKRELLGSSNTTVQQYPSHNSYNDGQSQNIVLMNGNSDQLEWKIDVHVARHSARSGLPTISKQALEDPKVPRITEHAKEVTHENDLIPDNGLGMKLTVEGRGGESSSYLDLQKAWASVGLFLHNFFGENTEQNLENGTDVAFTTSDTKQQITPLQRLDKLQILNSTVSNKAELQDRSLPSREDDILSVDTQNDSESSEFITGTMETAAIPENEISEGFVGVQQLFQTSQELDQDFSIQDREDEIEHTPNVSKRNEPRFFFGFLNRGSGDTETSTTESIVDTRRREGRFIFGLFRPRPTPAQDSAESGSGDNPENVDPGRSSRVEFVKQLSERKLFHENSSNISDENFNKTVDPLPRVERLFSEVFEVGSGDSRALVRDQSEEEYTASPSIEPRSLNDSEYISDTTGEIEITNKDYFLETFTESYSLEVHDSYERLNIYDYYDDLDVQVSEFDRAVNYSEYDLEDEIVLFQSVTASAKETTEIPETTEQLDARFFGGLFSEGSGDPESFSWRKMGNESQTLSPISEYLSEDNTTSKNYSGLSQSNGYEILDLSLIPEATYTSASALNIYEAHYTETSTESIFRLEQNDLKEINTEYVLPEAIRKPQKMRSDSYLGDYQHLSTEYGTNEHTANFVVSLENDYTNLKDKFSSGSVAFSSGEEKTPNTTTEGTAALVDPQRGARFLDDDYGCYDPECLENDSSETPDNKSLSMNEASFSEEVDSSFSFIDTNDSFSAFESQTAPIIIGTMGSLVPSTSATSQAVPLDSIPDAVADLQKSSNNKTYGFHLYDSETYSDLILSEVLTNATEAPYLMEQSILVLKESNLSSTEDFTDLFNSESGMSSNPSKHGTTTPRPHQERRCKASWQCNEKLNERCLNGSTCGCGRSFVRHPTTKRCEVASAMVEAVLRFSGESYHEDLKNPETERYQKTMKAAKDTMKTLLQENSELASTVADMEVTGFKLGSLVVTWNLIIPADGSESMDVIVNKVDHGLTTALGSPSVLQKLPFKSFNVDVLQVYQSVSCVPGYCGDHGICEITKGSIKCNCQGWYLGDRCQISGVVVVGSASTSLILLVIVGLLAYVVSRYKRSSAYGNDVEERFQRTAEYGLDRKGTKALGDVLPVEQTRTVPSHFLYLEHSRS